MLNMDTSFRNSALIFLLVVAAVNVSAMFPRQRSNTDSAKLNSPVDEFIMTEDEYPTDSEPNYLDSVTDLTDDNVDYGCTENEDLADIHQDETYPETDWSEELTDPAVIPRGALDIEGCKFNATRVTQVLKIKNGGRKGTWGKASFCPKDSFAAGYSMKIQPHSNQYDNTALNALKIVCKDRTGAIRGYGTSKVGTFGTWGAGTYCKGRGSRTDFLTAFRLQAQQGSAIEASYAAFKCRGLSSCNKYEYEIVQSPGHGICGSWSSWSASCPTGSAVCGIKTRVETNRGCYRDDTGLNDAIFYCCDL
ncbi:Vitelline membrane outer layer protein 1 [Mactra antiquata]